MKSWITLLFIILSAQSIAGESKSFYNKFKRTEGLLIKGSSQIEDQSLERASVIIEKMISKRSDIKERLIFNSAEVAIIAKNESYCDLPEAHDLRGQKTFDGRDFCKICGGGGVVGRPITAICEDNLLRTVNDPYKGKEDILVHEFAHTMHLLGMSETDKKLITYMYQDAKMRGAFNKNHLSMPSYMMANEQEFFACLSAVWFGVNRESASISNELSDRESIRIKLPAVYTFLKSIYPE